MRCASGGAQEGGWEWGKDALRVLVVAGPAIRLGRMGLTRLAKDVDGPICTWVSATQALRQTGAKAFATVEDLARASGLRLPQLGGAHPKQLIPALQSLGAKGAVKYNVQSLDEVARLARQNTGDVVQFSLLWGKDSGHV